MILFISCSRAGSSSSGALSELSSEISSEVAGSEVGSEVAGSEVSSEVGSTVSDEQPPLIGIPEVRSCQNNEQMFFIVLFSTV